MQRNVAIAASVAGAAVLAVTGWWVLCPDCDLTAEYHGWANQALAPEFRERPDETPQRLIVERGDVDHYHVEMAGLAPNITNAPWVCYSMLRFANETQQTRKVADVQIVDRLGRPISECSGH